METTSILASIPKPDNCYFMSKHRLKAYTYLLVVAIIWGVAGPIIKFTLGGIDPLPFLVYRFTISAIISFIFFGIKGFKIKNPGKNIPKIIIYGLLAFSLALGTLFTGLKQSSVLDLTLISAISPLIVTAGGAIFFKDRITKKEKLGIAIVLVGALINSFAPFFSQKTKVEFTGNLFIISYLIFDISATLFAKKALRDKISPLTLTNSGFIIGALTIIPFTFLKIGASETLIQIASLPLKYHLGVWYMAVFSGTLAYYLYVLGQKSIEVSEAVLFGYLQPIFSVPLAVFWLGESLTPTFIIGAFLIATGVFVAERKKKRTNQT